MFINQIHLKKMANAFIESLNLILERDQMTVYIRCAEMCEFIRSENEI